ncbi:uncharacterized protein EI90DRAFT_3076173 [Cantharellus anzutake]|uniref:uncharacterized protein n=1 Tax=Cantharellus anzutake TaxID=1750568 RepID=UPI0019055B45|nr:uncharacterized protein EI90DRAFT_3076173 [Cantharellus anzutake]KAF8324184.1 hypothetical protein EI90DRAFT_3076173 [Cantharellus anzutake]
MSGKGHQPSASRRQKGKFPAYQLFSRAPQSSHALGPVPEIQIDGPSGTQSLGDIRSSGHDGSIGSHPERSLAIVPTAASSRSLGGSETSPLRRTIKWFGKWSSSNRRRPTLSHPGLSVANTRLHPAPDTSWLSHLCPEQNVGNPPSTPSIPTTIDTIPSLHSQLESIGSDPEVLGPTGPPPALAGDRKKPIIIGTTKLLLQAATFALKASPIPLLGEIPNLLLSFLQVYEV